VLLSTLDSPFLFLGRGSTDRNKEEFAENTGIRERKFGYYESLWSPSKYQYLASQFHTIQQLDSAQNQLQDFATENNALAKSLEHNLVLLSCYLLSTTQLIVFIA
jgi:hypothetical protein